MQIDMKSVEIEKKKEKKLSEVRHSEIDMS